MNVQVTQLKTFIFTLNLYLINWWKCLQDSSCSFGALLPKLKIMTCFQKSNQQNTSPVLQWLLTFQLDILFLILWHYMAWPYSTSPTGMFSMNPFKLCSQKQGLLVTPLHSQEIIWEEGFPPTELRPSGHSFLSTSGKSATGFQSSSPNMRPT